MDQAENMNFPEEMPDNFEKLLNNFTKDTSFNQSQVNQIIISIFSVDHNEILQYQQSFISFLVTPPQISNELLVSSEILTLIAISLSSFQISYLDKPIHDSFIKSWSTLTKQDDIDTDDLFKLGIIFYQLSLINDISRKQLCILASIFIHFLELDCISNKFPISLISFLLDCLNQFFKKNSNPEMKRRVISACNYYLNATAQPILMLIANKFIIQNHNQYDKCLQYITQSLQNVRYFQNDSLHNAFTSISDNLYLKLKNCSPWSINDAFLIVTSFSNAESLIREEQINAILALNFFGIEKKIDNETHFFNFSINSLSNEKVDIPLIQICDSFRFSPTISIRNYQIFTIFFLYSIKIDTFLLQLRNETVSDDQLLNTIESFGRNFEYFKTIVTSIIFFNNGLENGFFNTINKFKKPIMNQFIQTMKLFFQLSITFSSKYEYPKDEFTEYDDDCDTLLYKISKECKHITIIKKSWEIVNYVTRRIFEFLSIFPDNILYIIYSNFIKLLFSEKAGQLYVIVMSAFLPCMKKFTHFLNAFYSEILNEIENSEFIKNAFIFLRWLNQFLKKNPQKGDLNDHFIHSTTVFFVNFFKFTFSTSYSILLHSSLIKELLKLMPKLFGDKVLFKIVPADVLIELYFNVPSSNKENKFLNQLMIQFYASHKSILSNFEWYRKLLLKHAILRPKITIPAIKENNIIYDYRNTLEFQKFSRDLLTIFDSYSSNELRKIVLEMISYIPAKFTTYSALPIVDVSNYWVYTISYNEKMIVINGRDLVNYIREIITCNKPENQFEDFVNFVNFHSKSENESKIIQIEKVEKSDGLSEIFSFLGLLASSAIEKCEFLEQFLFIQDIFTLIIRFGKDYKKYLPKNLTPTFLAHFVVSLAINNYSFNDELNDYYLYNDDTPEFFSDFLSEVEKVLFKVSYPFYHHSIFVAIYLIEHFSKSSIDFIQFTRFTVNFILRQLDDQVFPSHHSITDDEITFNLCHFLPTQVFDIVIFLKENVYNYNAIDFLPLFSIKLPFIAMFSLCEIVSKTQLNEIEKVDDDNDDSFENLLDNEKKKKEVVDFLNEFAEIDITQIVPLLLLFPEHQEKYVNLFNESIKNATSKNQTEPVKIPFIFCLLDLPQSTFKNSIEALKNCFIESSASDSLLISSCLLKAYSKSSESKKAASLSSFVEKILTTNGFSNSLFVTKDLSSFKYLFSLFVLQPSIVIESIKDQLILLDEKKYKNSFLVDSNFKFFVDFLSLPSVLSYLIENKEYKEIGKLLLKIYSKFSFDVADSMICYFVYKPKIWIKFLTKNITKEDYIFFFYENIHSKKLSQIIIEIKENTKLLTEHLQNEYVQLFAIENSEISYNQIKESFMSFVTQKNRHHFQQIISYLVENGEIWDLILSILKSNKVYLIQTLKVEIMKSQSNDFESLPEFIRKIQIEYLSSFFDFFFDCYQKLIDIELFQNIVSNIESKNIPLFERICQKYSFNFEFDFGPFAKNEINDDAFNNEMNEWTEYAHNSLIFDRHNDQEIRSILDKIDLDSPSYIFEEIEKLVLNENYESINTLMMRFINHRNHFVSILKFVNKNKETFYENFFELFSNELALFISLNLLNTDEENLCENIKCFNALCSFIPPSDECNELHLIWAKKLTEIANSILPVFVKDDNFFHSNYSEFNSNLILLVSIFGSQCVFVKTYFGIISKFYYENNSLILHELFESIPEIVSHLDKLNENEFNPFISLLCQILNDNKNSIFPYALYTLKKFNQKGFGNIKKITGLFSLIVKDELTEIPLSKLNFNFDFPFLDSLKNIFCRWFLKDIDTDNFKTIMDKVGQKSDMSNWLLFSRSQMTDDFNSTFSNESQYNHFFSIMPFEIIKKYSKYIIDESSIPIYYYKQLSYNRKKTCNNEKNPLKPFLIKKKEEKGKFKSFFKLFSIDYYYNHIITNTENKIISFKSDPNSIEALNYLNSDQISFYSGVDACICQPGLNSNLININYNNNRNSTSTFQLLQDAMTIIGIPKCYPNQIIERLNRAKDAAFVSLKSSEIVQFLCLCSLCNNPIVPPYFSRYHSLKLFEDFNRILNFATTKGINVDFSPLEKSEPFITQSQCNLNSKEKVQILKTKENFLIYALKNQFDNPHIWADLSAIENDDMLYLFLHSNLLPLNAKKEILKQIKEFPFRWCQLLFDDINRGVIHESFISLVSDVFRIDYSSVFSPILNLNEIQKLRTKSHFESKIMDEEHPSHNFSFIVNPVKKFFSVLPICPPLVPTDPLSTFNFPMHSIFLSIEKENSSSASIEICLSDGSKVNYLLTAMINNFSPELFVISHLLNKIMRKRVYCRSKHTELISPLFQSITKNEKNRDLFIVRTNAKQLVQYSIYDDLLKVKREGKYPQLKNFNQFRNFKASKDFFAWETAFLHRFAALSHFQVGLNLRVFLPFHLLVDEKDASIQFIQIRKTFSEHSFVSDKNKETVNGQKVRIYGELIKYISPQLALEVLPTAMANIAMSFKFYGEKVSVILNNLIGIGYSEKMERFNESLLNKDGLKVVENLISSSCYDVPISDIPWF